MCLVQGEGGGLRHWRKNDSESMMKLFEREALVDSLRMQIAYSKKKIFVHGFTPLFVPLEKGKPATFDVVSRVIWKAA